MIPHRLRLRGDWGEGSGLRIPLLFGIDGRLLALCNCVVASDALRRRTFWGNIIYNSALPLHGFGLVDPPRVLLVVLLLDDVCLDLIKLPEGWGQIVPGRGSTLRHILLFLSSALPLGGIGDKVPGPIGAEDHKAVGWTRNAFISRGFCFQLLGNTRHCREK